jgi:histidine triad (HIT) family protein
MDKSCIFCRIVAGEIPARLLYEDDDIVAFADIAGQAPVHLLVVPRRHVPHLFDASASDPSSSPFPSNTTLLGRMILVATDLARGAGLESSGFRLVMNCLEGGGQSVFHLHLHLLGGRPFAWPPG